MVKVDRRIRWHYTTTILRLRIGARLTRYRNCKFHNFARTISRHADTADGISRYSVPPSAGPHLPLVPSVCPSGSLSRAFVESILKQTLCDSLEIITALSVKFRYTPENHNRPQTTTGEWRPQETIGELTIKMYWVGQKVGPQTHDHNSVKSEPIYNFFHWKIPW